jgi:muramidase (phage lysozyme)
MLSLIAWSEGTSTSPITKNDGYDVIVTGVDGPEVFTDYSDHPFAKGRTAIMVRENPPLFSTASGRYQILLRYWRSYQQMLNLPDFSPQSQDAVALRIIYERGALPLLNAGNIEAAIVACSNIWASFPGNDYSQGGHSMAELLTQFQNLDSLA